MRDTERREELLAAEIAADWLQRLRNGGPEVHAQFARWLRESPRHIREMLLASAYGHALRHMKAHRPVDVGSLKEQCQLETRLSLPEWPAVDRNHPSEHSRGKARVGTATPTSNVRAMNWRFAAIALILVIASISALAIRAVSERRLSTGPGEWQVAHLEDGTVLHLGPRTQVSVNMGERERTLSLKRGEIMAYVAKDATKPFFVQTDSVTARAVGTAFAVQQFDARHVVITVKEGLVAVRRRAAAETQRAKENSAEAAIVLKAGEKAEANADGSSLRARAIDVDQELAWVEGKLIIDNTVAAAIEEMNRRNRIQIRLLDPAIGQRRIVGVFQAADPVSFARALEKALSVSVVEDGRDALLLMPHGANGPEPFRAPAAH